MWNIMFLILCLIFASMLFIVFNSKETIHSKENKLFSIINLMTIIGVLIEILLQVVIKTMGPDHIVSVLFQRVYLAGVAAWFTAFSLYVFYILNPIYKLKENKFKLLKMAHYSIYIILFILYMVLKINCYASETSMYTYGPAVNLLKITIGGYMALWIILSIIRHKLIFKKSYIPIMGIYILIIANLILQSIDPTILIVSFTITIVCYLMYFTIENPDLKMVNELYENKHLMEQTYVDKSNFLFEMTQEVRSPIYNIKCECNQVKDSNNINDYKKALEKINDYSKQLDFIVNDVLNINTLDANQIKFVNNKFRLDLILNEVISSTKEAINPNVKFTYDFDKSIPELYGDSIKLKQIISALLLESARRTTEGFIDFRVDALTRFDALRLIIQIKDSSKGIPIETVNSILNTTVSLDKKDIELLEQNELSMELCQKVVKLMDGNLIIKSTKKHGAEIILTIDEVIDSVKEKINDYEKYISKSKTVGIVNQDKKQIEFLKKFFSNNDINSTVFLNGINLIDKIKAGKKYDYIIVSNNMKSINGYTIYQKLKEIEGFNIPVMIITENESLKKHLLDDGFDEVLTDENLSEDLTKIINMY